MSLDTSQAMDGARLARVIQHKGNTMFKKKRDNCRDIFRDFSGEVIPEIDIFIKEFFERKIAEADSDFMKEITGCRYTLANVCLLLNPVL